MSTCMPLTFGKTNDISLATLTANREPTTNINWIKNEYRSRPARWTTVEDDVIITGTFASLMIGEYFSIPSVGLGGDMTVQLKLFETLESTTDLLDMEPIPMADLIPLGQWMAGADPYGEGLDPYAPSTLTLWFGEVIQCRKFELHIVTSEADGAAFNDLRVRTMHIGRALKLEKNFDYGMDIQYVSEPELIETTSGSRLPFRPQRQMRTMSLQLSHMTEIDRLNLSQLERFLNGRPFVVSAYPGEKGWQYNDYTFLARFANALTYTRANGRHAVPNITIIEV